MFVTSYTDVAMGSIGTHNYNMYNTLFAIINSYIAM